MPPFLRDDRHRFSEFQRKYWPSLALGRKHGGTQMHGSDQMLPWWFKIIAGKVDIRIMRVEEWRPKFATGQNPLIINDPNPDFNGPFDAFDDDELNAANVTVYKTIAKAGDWVYAPVGALRATRVIGEEPIVAAFGFFFDPVAEGGEHGTNQIGFLEPVIDFFGVPTEEEFLDFFIHARGAGLFK